MWKHIEEDNGKLSIHDCYATQIWIENHDLVIEFADGFWIVQGNTYNPYDQTYRSECSQMKVMGFEVDNLFVLRPFQLFCRPVFTLKSDLKFNRLMKKVNTGRWKLLFATEYHTFHQVLFDCWIYPKYKRRALHCYMIIDNNRMEYCWNEIRKDSAC